MLQCVMMRNFPLLVAIGIFAAIINLPINAVAQSKTLTKVNVATAPLTSSQSQVDGITSRIVDNLWSYSDVYFHDGDYNRIISLCRLISEADPSFDEAYENAAYLLWSQGDTQSADRFLQYGLKRSKDQLTLLLEFGRHLNATKRPDAAIPYLKRASLMPQAGPLVFVQLGHCYEKVKQYDKAVATWSTLVKKFPDFPSGPPNLARAKALLKGKK